MRDAYAIVAALHRAVNSMHMSAFHDFRDLSRALVRNDLSPHPDEFPALQLTMMLDARTLRSLAAEIDARRAELERDAVQYLAAAE